MPDSPGDDRVAHRQDCTRMQLGACVQHTIVGDQGLTSRCCSCLVLKASDALLRSLQLLA